jgi:hypothetical protein
LSFGKRETTILEIWKYYQLYRIQYIIMDYLGVSNSMKNYNYDNESKPNSRYPKTSASTVLDGVEEAATKRALQLQPRQEQRIRNADTIACSPSGYGGYPSFSIAEALDYSQATAAGCRSLTSYYDGGLGQRRFPTIDSPLRTASAAYSQQHHNSGLLMRALAAQRSSDPSPFLLATLQAQQLAVDYSKSSDTAAVSSTLAYNKEKQQGLVYQHIHNQELAPYNMMSSNNILASLQSFKAHAALHESHHPSSSRDNEATNRPIPSTTTFSTSLPSLQQHHLAEDSLKGYGTFPLILHRALAELQRSPNGSDIACFLPDGKSFAVRNQFLLVTKVLPLFFPNMRSFSSFQRQLNFYDFKRIGGAGIDRGSYAHELFLRDFPGLANDMKRTKIKGAGTRKLLAAAVRAKIDTSKASVAVLDHV